MRELVLVTDKWTGKLEELMLAFMNGEFDVLHNHYRKWLMPNANTIFINNANNFGLSDLHQMRGRGRSNKKAFVISFVRLILP
jgi:transcription-repair coupling factor (superfamily II helicase)